MTQKTVVLLGIIVLLLSSFQLSRGEIINNTSSSNPAIKNFDILAPTQPLNGPGGKNYSHENVRKTRYNWGEQMFWIFEPDTPMPKSAPVIVFNHGWTAIHPIVYQAWIDHLVLRGNIVIFPRYQQGLVKGFWEFSNNAIIAVQQAFMELEKQGHVQPEYDHFAITGHSFGGGITMDMAALAQERGLPIPKAIMPVQPAISFQHSVDYQTISNETLMLIVVGEDDDVVGKNPGKLMFYGTPQIPSSRKNFIIQQTDTHGSTGLISDHFAPICTKNMRVYPPDAMDFYCTWKLFDALTDFAFYGNHQEFCLGNTTQQRFMGLWSDETPVKELMVTISP